MALDGSGRVAVVTGASAGIGAATVRALAGQGFSVVAGARRVDRLQELSRETHCRALVLDVTDQASVDAFCAELPEAHILINNAGGALGLDTVANAKDEHWETMYDANVLGLMRMTRALLPKLEASGNGHIVNVGSIAGREAYPGGAGYNAVKFAVVAVTKVLRMELNGKRVRVSEIAPGMTETEFSMVRFSGDAERAAKVYEGVTPLTADDIADAILWAVTRPWHVNIDEIVMRPLAQATATMVARGKGL